MPQTVSKTEKKTLIERPPVVAVLGHIDHGKSTLLDYIRKTNVVDAEVGGITQKISAYEIEHKAVDGKIKKITFIDTPGHEAFQEMRKRGSKVADVAILVVSAEDGVKPQTIEAYKAIEESKTPFIVAITKIDKPNADIDRAKVSLAENGVYLEGYGGTISFVPISAKTGEGVPALLDLILLSAEILDLKGDASRAASGIVVESSRDSKKGVSATLIIKDGTLQSGTTIVAGDALAPARIIEDSNGKKIVSATFSSPVVVSGWSKSPKVGATFEVFEKKKDAEEKIASGERGVLAKRPSEPEAIFSEAVVFPIIIKADVAGSLEAIMYEIEKVKSEKVIFKIVHSGTGNITESDVKFAGGATDAAILGFNVSSDASARAMAERMNIPIMHFDIIYKLSEWLAAESAKRTPKVTVEEIAGTAKILRFFSKTKDRQIIGARALTGEINVGHQIKVMRNSVEIKRGLIRGLEQAKQKTDSVAQGFEFGAMIECAMDLAPGDMIEDIVLIEK
jgi:translation initiation factor IF-2